MHALCPLQSGGRTIVNFFISRMKHLPVLLCLLCLLCLSFGAMRIFINTIGTIVSKAIVPIAFVVLSRFSRGGAIRRYWPAGRGLSARR